MLQSVQAIRATETWPFRAQHPLDFGGVLTWIDPGRRLMVIQDGTAAIALQVDANELPKVPIGRRVQVKAADAWPVLPAVPDLPLHPSGREYLTSFAGPTNWKANYIARVRGYVYPPVTGEYRFFIASDDTSQLWLGTDDSPTSARPIASVETWITKPAEWNHVPSQRSAPIRLEAGKRYYIEAVHEQRQGADHLNVAWEGPGFPVQTIAGRDLSPWLEASAAESAGRAARGQILREYWLDRAIANAALLTAPRVLDTFLAARDVVVRDMGAADLPEPWVVKPGTPASAQDSFRWVEIEGTVEFVAHHDDTLVLELSEGAARSRVMIPDWHGQLPPRLAGRRMRLRGAGEIARNETSASLVSTVWVQAAEKLTVLDDLPRAAEAWRTSIAELLAGDAMSAQGRLVKVHGRVVSSANHTLVLSDRGSFYGFVSADGVAWKPLGNPIEVPMADAVEVGFFVSSRSTEKIATAVFDHVQGIAPTATQTNVGNGSHPGELGLKDGVYTLRGSGHEVWFSPDQFYFVHQPLVGAGEIVARIAAFSAADPWAKGGIMIRESLATDAQFVDLVQTGSKGCSLQWRKTEDGSAPNAVNDATFRPPHWVKLVRKFSSLTVAGERITAVKPGTVVEVMGFVNGRNGTVGIDDAFVRELDAEFEKPSFVESRPLVDLARVVAPSGNPDRYDVFKVRGVITFMGDVDGRRYVSIQDRSGAAFVSPETAPNSHQAKPGKFVELQSDGGAKPLSPFVTMGGIFVLGEGAFPTPLRHPLEYLLPRRGDASWIELEGIVRSVAANGTLQLKEMSEAFSVAIAGASPAALRRYIDAQVRLRGVITFPNDHDRLLLVPSVEQVQVLEEGRNDAFALPTRPIKDVAATVLPNHPMHRVKVRGAVTLLERDHLYLQDGSAGARVILSPPAALALGDEIEASGFPELAEDRSLVLEAATVRGTGAHATPEAPPATYAELAAGRHKAKLVRVQAIATQVRTNDNGATFELLLDQHVLRATLNGATASLPSVPPGSLVAITGVCTAERTSSAWSEPATTGSPTPPGHLVMRTVDDLVVLQKPRWWVVKRTLLVTSMAVCVLLLSLAWIHILRRRVDQRTRELHATMEKLQRETQTSATLAERNRLAGEIHDSLEQGFSGLILQLDTTAKQARCPPEVRAGLALARNMVAFSRNEVRHAVWDLHSPILENADLGTALKKIAEQLAPDAPQVDIRVEGTVRPLGSATEHHLLRIAQEALTNALKHAAAQRIEVTLVYADDAVGLRIRDDGRGFSTPDVLNGFAAGHFGLRSLRGRAHKIHGELEITSEPGKGTTIGIRVPTSALPSESHP